MFRVNHIQRSYTSHKTEKIEKNNKTIYNRYLRKYQMPKSN